MINDLKDFKNSTKRIQSLLQTFEIKSPEAFKLSNSAALNFMARILGYENYNTIKAVLDKNISKGNKMFIEINQHNGVAERSFDGHNWNKSFNNCHIGLNQITKVKFSTEENEKIIEFSFGAKEVDEQWVDYKFNKEGMGEYNRIKRILDENVIK